MTPRRRRAAGWAALAVGLALASASASRPASPPTLSRDADGYLVLSRLPAVLADDEVTEILDSGLTTTFAFRVDLPPPAAVEGGARVDVRWEPWDEVYHVTTLGVDGRVRRRVLADRDALEGWWRALRLRVAPPPASPVAGRAPPATPARVRLEVLPFSRAERDDAQRWFARSLEEAGATTAEAVGESAAEAGGGLAGTLGLLMATSIERRAVARYDWRVPVTAAPGGGR